MRVKVLIMLSLGILLVAFKFPQQGDWVYERGKEGIKIFTRKSNLGKLRDSKATMVVSTSPDQMLKILTDFSSYPTWMPRCKEARVVARLSDSEFITYMVISAPWPLKDRDCVMRVKISKDAQTGVITITETSDPKYVREQDGVVRIKLMVSTWTLVPGKDGTLVTNEYSSNPGGDVPDWLTNTQSVENPLNTFENLQQKTASKKP